LKRCLGKKTEVNEGLKKEMNADWDLKEVRNIGNGREQRQE
jgi:hypothetical protein